MLDKGKNPSFVARRSVTSEDVVSPDEEFDVLSEGLGFTFLESDLRIRDPGIAIGRV